jgi:hypothetical protein
MMRLLVFILSLLLSLSVLSQEAGLLKAEIKTKSKLNKLSKSQGFELVGISARFGKGMENITKVEESVTNIEYSGDTLLVEVSLVANCCASFVAELETTNNKILNIVFEKNDINCLCLKGIYLTYKIIAKKGEYAFQMNGTPIKMRKIDPNAETEEMELWDNGNMKSIKVFIGGVLHTEHLFDEAGKRTKTLNYEGSKIIEKNY